MKKALCTQVKIPETLTGVQEHVYLQVQLLVFAVLCGFGGVTYIGVEPRLSLQNDIKTFLGMETIHKWTPPNIWIGPDQRFLIGNGFNRPPDKSAC